MAVQSLLRLALSSIVLSCAAVHVRKHDVTEQEGSNAIMMFAHGCSGSSAAVDILRRMLIAHHVSLAATGNDELMKTLKQSTTEERLQTQFWTAWDQSPEEKERVSSVLKAESLKEKFEVLYKAAQKNHSTILFKNELSEGHSDPDAVEYMQKIGTKVLLFLRMNLLDDLSCRVKDFCDKPENEGVGVNVDAKGKELGCAFRGRGEDEKEAMKADTSSVRLNVDKLIETLDNQAYMDGLHSEFLEKMGFANFEIFSAEDLFAFEYGETYASDGFALSTSRWQKLLSHVGVTPDEATVKSVLKAYGTFPAPKTHDQLFWNFHEIVEALRGTEYYDMLRM